MSKNIRCVILGASGFIGSALRNELNRVGINTLSVSRDIQNLEATDTNSHLKIDLNTDVDNLIKTIQKDDYIFNLIAPSVPSFSKDMPLWEINNHIYPQVSLIEKLFKKGIKKYVYFSSGGGIYGYQDNLPIKETVAALPVSPHAIAKLTIENYLNYYSKQYRVPIIIYRVSNPYGPGQKQKKDFGIIPTLINNVKSNNKPVLHNQGNIIKDFIYIQDLVEAVVLSFCRDNKYEIYNLGSGVGTSIKDIWEIIKETTGSGLRAEYGEKRIIDAEKVILDINRFRLEHSWQPKIDISNGIKQLLLSQDA